MAINDFNRYGEELEKIMILRTSPVAVKMLEKESDIPDGAIRPRQDRGYHLAQCQAFAMSRRDKTAIAMLKEDHWCPAALMAYGMVPPPDQVRGHPYERFEYGKYIGILTAPLSTADFEPDVVIIYSNTSQLRGLLLSLDFEEIPNVNGRFFPPSCAHAVVTPMLKGGYWIVIPDPGEYQRAMAGEDEMIFSVRVNKLEGFVVGLTEMDKRGGGYSRHTYDLMPDFPRPEFYKRLFEQWGLDVEPD